VDVVQLYGRDLLASVVRPVTQLLGYQRVALQPGESATVRFDVPTTRLAFADRSYNRVVEPGEVEVWVAASAGEKVATAVAEGIAELSDVEAASAAGESGTDKALVTITGDVHRVGPSDQRMTTAAVSRI